MIPAAEIWATGETAAGVISSERQSVGYSRDAESDGWRSGAKAFDYSIVEGRADLADGIGGAIGPCSIGQQDDREILVGIDPEGCARIAEVTDGARSEVVTRG